MGGARWRQDARSVVRRLGEPMVRCDVLCGGCLRVESHFETLQENGVGVWLWALHCRLFD